MGMLLLQVVQSGLVVVGVSANWQQISVGVIMVLAVGVDVARRRFSVRRVHSVDDVAALITDLNPATERGAADGRLSNVEQTERQDDVALWRDKT
jgi:hypothetical protein